MEISVPATSANLGPGFDTLGLALDFKNHIIIKPSRFFSLSIKGEGQGNPKIKSNNIFVNIFNEYYRDLTNSNAKFRFIFYNKIPISRGLGSSSAVIVSAITAAYELANIPISRNKILNLSLRYESHPDNITPAVLGGFTASIVKGGKVYAQKKAMPKEVSAVVVIPKKSISTNLSRGTLPNYYSKENTVFNLSRSSFLTACMFAEDWKSLRAASEDRMHQEVRMSNMPELFSVQKVALKHGALMSTLSGSGSTFFSMVYQRDSKRVANALKKAFPHFRVEELSFDNSGLVVY